MRKLWNHAIDMKEGKDIPTVKKGKRRSA